MRLLVDVPRFLGHRAPLSVLAGQVRSTAEPGEKAAAAGRLARQLVKRGIETREAISLAENSLALSPDPELALDVAGWWVEAGDLIRGAALLQSAAEDQPPSKRTDLLLRVARLYARSNQVPQAVQALRQAMEISPSDPRAYEVHGALGFWAEIPVVESARSYWQASRLRMERGEKGPAFENLLRAFEVAPSSEEAANALASALRERDRPGAADEILREHLRHGSAALRAAHHQRAFYTALKEGDPARALESALEADLDLELDAQRIEEELRGPFGQPRDFEAFLVAEARAPGTVGVACAQWLVTLIDVHIFDWGVDTVRKLRAEVVRIFRLETATELSEIDNEQSLRHLRKELGAGGAHPAHAGLREEIALRECARGAWGDAFEVFQPLLAQPEQSLRTSALGVVIAGRCRKPVERAQALTRLAAWLPGKAGAVAHAVASEMLLAHDLSDAAWRAATAAVEAEPTSERALASQALVALSAPGGASAGLLEKSLSVLVARGEACVLLCQSANERGSQGLGFTWAARALALRPGDEATTRLYVAQAVRAKDAEKIIEALTTVLEQSAPIDRLANNVAQALRALVGVSTEQAMIVGAQVLVAIGVRSKEVVDALLELGRACHAPALLASITERQLVVAPTTERAALSLSLCRQRLSAGQPDVAARALRRALSQGADRALIQAALADFDHTVESDGKIALLEIEAELSTGSGSVADSRKAAVLRVLGAARWDMAQDTAGAIALWLKAADLDPEKGLEFFAHYLHHIAGPEAAATHLQNTAGQTEDPGRSARLLGFAAHELFELNRRPEAFDLAKTALERAPLMTELLSIAESCAPEDRIGDLLRLYDLLAESSMGCYGERAVHYRAARQLEKRGMPDQALAHACSAFEAVPAEGVAFVLMARLADSTAGHGLLVAALERAADAARNDAERARWLAKAAALADTESIGRRQRVDILLRAAHMLPEQETVTALLDSLAHFLADEPDAIDEMWESFHKVALSALRHASGAHGAQLTLVFGRAGLSHFEQPDFALTCLEQAVELDREIPDYETLTPFATQIAGLPERALAFLEHVKMRAEQDTMLLGRGLAVFSGRIAELLDEHATWAELLVRAATDFPEDAELLALARDKARSDGREDLIKQVESLLPVTEVAQSILERLHELSAEAGLEELLSLDLDAAPEELRAQLLEAIGTRQQELGRHVDAALSFRELSELQPENDVALRGIERDADQSGNYEELVRVLKTRIGLTQDPGAARRLMLRRVAVLETRLGRGEEARELLATMVEETHDLAALRMLADSWERAGNHGVAAELWLKVQGIAADIEEGDDAAYRAATCFAESAMQRRASQALELIKRPGVLHRKLGLELARTLGEPEAIREQLVGLARVMVGDNQLVEALYLEAAQISLARGDYDKAESAAKGARMALPQSSSARLLAARLRLRRGPLKDISEAREMLAELSNNLNVASAVDLEVLGYCRAQATVVAESKDAARRLLEQAIEDQGRRGLLALGLAELVSEDGERALGLYEAAIGAELHGMKSEGEVLLAAGALAREQSDWGRARAFVSAISDDDPLRVRAAKELEEIALEHSRAQREAHEKKKAADEQAAAQDERARKAAEARAAAEEAAANKAVLARQEAAEKAAAEKKAAEKKAAEEKATLAAEQKAAAEKAAVKKFREEKASAERKRVDQEAIEKKAAAERALAEQAQDTAATEQEAAEQGGHRKDGSSAAAIEAIRQAAREEHRRATAAVLSQEALAPPQRVSASPSQLPRQASVQPEALGFALVGVGTGIGSPPVPRLSEEMAMEEGRVPLPAGSAPGLRPQDAPPDEVSADELELYTEGDEPQVPGLGGATDDALVAALEAGDVEAGRQLLQRMVPSRSRSRDAVIVAQHLAALRPGDASILGLLVSTAAQDGNQPLAASVRHVLGAYGAGDPVLAPPADELIDQREAALNLVNQGATSPLHEALGIVWEHCQGLYKKDLSAYGISGVERVPLSAPTPIGALYRDASKILGMSRTPVFRLPGEQDIAIQLGLLSPPAVIVAGDINGSSPELAFHFGAMLAGSSPEHALLFGCAPLEVQNLLDALALSFGMGRASGSNRADSDVTRVASFLWETVPSRAQRRLSQLCKDPETLSFVPVAASSRRVLRRAGLLVCGDLPTAVADACGEAGLGVPRTLSELAEAAGQSAGVADLLGLALSPEYAELRFRTRH